MLVGFLVGIFPHRIQEPDGYTLCCNEDLGVKHPVDLVADTSFIGNGPSDVLADVEERM